MSIPLRRGRGTRVVLTEEGAKALEAGVRLQVPQCTLPLPHAGCEGLVVGGDAERDLAQFDGFYPWEDYVEAWWVRTVVPEW